MSTAGFDRRVYRNRSYQRMRRDMVNRVEQNAALGSPVTVAIPLQADGQLGEVLRDPDFQPILAHKPQLDDTSSFTSEGGRITRDILPAAMSCRLCPRVRQCG